MHATHLSHSPSFSDLPIITECSDFKLEKVLKKCPRVIRSYLRSQSTTYHLLETNLGNQTRKSFLLIDQNPYTICCRSNLFCAYKIRKLILEKFLLFIPLQKNDSSAKTPFSLRQALLQKKAAALGIAAAVYPLSTYSTAAFLVQKIEGSDLQSYIKSFRDIPLKDRLDLSIKIIERVLILHKELGFSHQSIRPSNILLQRKFDGNFVPLFCGFSQATEQKISTNPLEEDLYQPIEWEYNTSLTDLEKKENPLEAKGKDVYQVGLTLFYLFKGAHFKEQFERYLGLSTIVEDWNQKMSTVGSLDEFSFVRDDFCRDFLEFSLHDLPNPVRLTIRRLLKTVSIERDTLESALIRLKSVDKFDI